MHSSKCQVSESGGTVGNGKKTSPGAFSFIWIQLLPIGCVLGGHSGSLLHGGHHRWHRELVTSPTEGPLSGLAPVGPVPLHQVKWVTHRPEVECSF